MAYVIATPTARHFLSTRKSWVSPGRGKGKILAFADRDEAVRYAEALAVDCWIRYPGHPGGLKTRKLLGFYYVVLSKPVSKELVWTVAEKMGVDLAWLNFGHQAAFIAAVDRAWALSTQQA